ncbi:MAG: hypothetical protein KC549_05650 [Myxococcales bacterium]|nr:hypothetical protein [Myxococcales bacterium]MCB9546615.1 hypothetical protein [Myxococcales bacterium]
MRRCLPILAALALPGLAAAADPPVEPPPADEAAAVQRYLGLFVTTPDRREASERIVARQGRLEIWFLRSVPADQREQALCDGARWLLAGRLANSQGAPALFAALPDLQAVTLIFYRLETRVQPDADGRYQQQRDPIPEARFKIGREKASQLDAATLRKTLTGPRCASLGASVLDEVWTP